MRVGGYGETECLYLYGYGDGNGMCVILEK